MKKLCFFIGASFLSMVLHANNSGDYFSGFYLGGGLGLINFDTDQSMVFDPSKVATAYRYNLSASESDNHFLGTVYLGYGYQFNSPLYIAAEAIAEFAKPSFEWSNSNIYWRVKQNNAYGGRLKLGVVHNNWLVYGLGGWEMVRIKRNVSFISGGIYNSGTMLLQNVSSSDSQTIGQLGAGLDIAMNDHWAVQFQYAHNFYDDSNDGINHMLITFNNPKGNYHSDLNSNEGTIGLRYRFG
ncbi:outer membrane protein [Legionella hackeliae]|uniref:Outer membrane protein beta-barrel domain-containing protein n=1 Tax=Legionella hackeliae TaxID=449 RepID=A0A0A8UUH5_LEGHA|nr:outer membrane beta-barrel protein [Legionella hackeliae]KTD13741.1 hypothetical protein Lhac_0585 [Legionella hackeliae]CEK10439.1 exported protein of unknown function [Legionella hackeliae]STX47175.1 Opacity protein and related surface antigens [Legionella hackeliae]